MTIFPYHSSEGGLEYFLLRYQPQPSSDQLPSRFATGRTSAQGCIALLGPPCQHLSRIRSHFTEIVAPTSCSELCINDSVYTVEQELKCQVR